MGWDFYLEMSRGLSWELRVCRWLKETKIDQNWTMFLPCTFSGVLYRLEGFLPNVISEEVWKTCHLFTSSFRGSSGAFVVEKKVINEIENWLHFHKRTLIQKGSWYKHQSLKAFTLLSRTLCHTVYLRTQPYPSSYPTGAKKKEKKSTPYPVWEIKMFRR